MPTWEAWKGVSLNGGTPISHPKSWSFLVGKPMVVGYHHSRKPPQRCFKNPSWSYVLNQLLSPDVGSGIPHWRNSSAASPATTHRLETLGKCGQGHKNIQKIWSKKNKLYIYTHISNYIKGQIHLKSSFKKTMLTSILKKIHPIKKPCCETTTTFFVISSKKGVVPFTMAFFGIFCLDPYDKRS